MDSGSFKFTKNTLKTIIHFNSYGLKNGFRPFDKLKFIYRDGQITDINGRYKLKLITDSGQLATQNAVSHRSMVVNQKYIHRQLIKNNYVVQPVRHNSRFLNAIVQYDPNFLMRAGKCADSMYQVRMQPKYYQNLNPEDLKAIKKLAIDLTTGISDDSLRILALCRWMVRNFRYDLSGPIKPDEVFHQKRTVCQGYADFIEQFCIGINLPCITIVGYADNNSWQRHIEKIGTNHAWNLVKINHQWRLLDVTWIDRPNDSNNTEGEFMWFDKYFLGDPKIFAEDHFPKNELFRFTQLYFNKMRHCFTSPVTKHMGLNTQYLGPMNNINITQDNILTFYVYSEGVSDCKILINGVEMNHAKNIELSPGVNQISVHTTIPRSNIRFVNDDIEFEFVKMTKSDRTKMILSTKTILNRIHQPYLPQFYDFILAQQSKQTFNFQPGMDTVFKNTDLWKAAIGNFYGRIPELTISQERISGEEAVYYQCAFSDITIENHVMYLRGQLKCSIEEFKKYPNKEFPLGDIQFCVYDKWLTKYYSFN